jgi:hypothetical protein
LCSAPAVYLTIDLDPELKRKALQNDGVFYSGFASVGLVVPISLAVVIVCVVIVAFQIIFAELVNCVTELQIRPIQS